MWSTDFPHFLQESIDILVVLVQVRLQEPQATDVTAAKAHYGLVKALGRIGRHFPETGWFSPDLTAPVDIPNTLNVN